MIRRHLPLLPVLLPLLAAPLCVVLGRRRPTYVLALGASWSSFAAALMLLRRVLDEGEQVYRMGGWASPWGIEYRIDVLSGFVVAFVSLLGAVVMTWAPLSTLREIPEGRHALFHAAYLLCLTGLLGIVSTGDLFNLFVFLEISSLSSYALISLGRSRRALTASFQYLVLGTIGATFILIAIGLMYQMTGTLNMADFAARLELVTGERTVFVAFAFFTVGVALKMALYPLHHWLPNAYTHAPSAVTAFLAATSTKVSVYVLIRFVYSVFGQRFSFETMPLGAVLVALSLAGIFAASTMAIFQRDVKRLLAYSSVAQVGYMTLGISMHSVTGLTAGIVHLFNHALIKGGMFLALGSVAWRVGSTRLEALAGIGRRMPLTTFAWVLGGLGLVGVPATAGFVSKWYLVLSVLERRWWPVAAALLVSSLLALVYVWRVVEIAYFREPAAAAPGGEAPLALLAPTWALIGASVWFGLSTSGSVGLARRAAVWLLGGGP